MPAEEIGRRAHAYGLTIYELTPRRASLEETFMELTSGSVEYRSRPTTQKAS